MSGDGTYIVLTREDAQQLFSAKEDDAVRKVIDNLRKSPKHLENDLVLECGSDWDPIHRALTEGKLDPDGGDFPLDHCVLGGRQLHAGDDFEVIVIRPDIVPHVAAALHDLRRADFVQNYMTIDPADYGKQPTEEEGDRAWSTLKLIRQMFEDAGNEHAAIAFTVKR